jgi:hypothetical protein
MLFLYFESKIKPLTLQKKFNMVTLTDILPNIRQLAFLDKIRLIRILAEEIDIPKNQEQTYFEPYKTYFLHTPQFEAGAAAILMQALMEAPQEN